MELAAGSGYPSVFHTFVNNMRALGHDDVIRPLPLPSLCARDVLAYYGIRADIVYVDALPRADFHDGQVLVLRKRCEYPRKRFFEFGAHPALKIDRSSRHLATECVVTQTLQEFGWGHHLVSAFYNVLNETSKAFQDGGHHA